MNSEVRDETFLLGRARQGDTPAFEEIVRRHQRRVYGVALRIVRSHAVADDVAQEAFLRAWKALDRFELGRPFGPLDLPHRRQPRREPRPLAGGAREDPLPEGHGEARASQASPLDGVLDGEAQQLLNEALEALPADQRAVFVLRTVEEMSYREIADALELSPGTVMSRLYRAREKLLRALAPYLGPAARSRTGERP